MNRIRSRLEQVLARLAVAGIALLLAHSANAQRRFNLNIAPTNANSVAIKWKAQSATPAGDLVIVPKFQVERSGDLKTWTPVSGLISSSPGQTNVFVDSAAGAEFYRVASLIRMEYAQLSHAKLANGELQFADFLGAELFGANLTMATLSNAVLSAADLRSADLTGADLGNADLFAVNATQAIFDFGSLAGADASFGEFEAASFFDVDLTGVDFSFATLVNADLDFAGFAGVILDANTLIDPKPQRVWQIVNHGAANAVLTNLDLSSARFPGVNFNGANLSRSLFTFDFLNGADLRGANFSNATMTLVTFKDALMDSNTIIDAKSRLTWMIVNQDFAVGRDLHGTNLTSVDCSDGNFTGAILSNALCSSSAFEHANFGGADLSRASCVNSDFIGASLTNANLTLVNFNSAVLNGASLLNSLTNGATFFGASFSNTVMPDGSIRNF